jgi:hypothetical protein
MNPDAFVRWAMDDARTVEERYGVELLIDRCDGRWHAMHNIPKRYDWELAQELKRQRKLNPAYEPHYTEEVARRITEVFPEVTSWSPPHSYDSRPQRDIKVFRFLPNLADVAVSAETEDLSPLLALPLLRKLSVSGGEGKDYRILAECRELRMLDLGFSLHWPDVTGLEKLTQLEVLNLSGNLLVFERGTTFPNVVRGSLSCTPLSARNVRDLPQLPACQFLTLSGVERLDGIEAFGRLRNLNLQAEVRDYSPLAALAELTFLTCSAAKPLDVAPLTRLPKLAYAAFTHNYRWDMNATPPRDYAPLVESPSLRELEVPGCAPVATEVAALNAAFPPWSDLWALTQPRPLPALRIISAGMDKHPRRAEVHLMPDELAPPDDGLRLCEMRWAARQIGRAVTKRLGSADWGKVESSDYGGKARLVTVRVESFGVIEKLGEIVEALREALAWMKPDYNVTFYVALKAPRLEPTAAQRQLQKQFDDEQERFDTEKRQREREEHLERLHRFNVKKQEGYTVKPEEFAAPNPESPPPAPWEREDEDEGGEGDGDVIVKEKPDPPPSWFDDEHPLADNYRMWGNLSLNELWLTADPGLVRYVMGREPDEVIEQKRPG